MAGDRLRLTARDQAVLADVAQFGVMTREQLTRLRHFASKTRANERLKRLTTARYLTARRQPLALGGPRLIYAPGSALEASRNRRRRTAEASDLFVAHQLGLVDARIAFDQHAELVRWLTDADLSTLHLGLVPDAYVEYAADGRTYSAFVEYDRGTEPLGTIEHKVRAYVDLAFSGRFARTFKRTYFRALFVTDSPGRLHSLSRAVSRVTDHVVRLTTRDALIHQGPLASIWRRPGLDRPESLTAS
jgi:hypothetical protein